MLQMLKHNRVKLKNNNTFFGFKAPEKLAETLREISYTERISISDIIVDALYDYFEKNNISVNKEV